MTFANTLILIILIRNDFDAKGIKDIFKEW